MHALKLLQNYDGDLIASGIYSVSYASTKWIE
jgi:hypothetical protein